VTSAASLRAIAVCLLPQALNEWEALDGSVKSVMKKLLKKRLDQPHVAGAQLHGGLNHCYKIKLLKQGDRLVYLVEDEVLVVLVLAVAKREDNAVTDRPLNALFLTNRRFVHAKIARYFSRSVVSTFASPPLKLSGQI